MLSLRSKPVGERPPWGSGPPLTDEERARVLQRFRQMKFRSFTLNLVFTPWVDAQTPEELVEAVKSKLRADSQGKSN